MLPLATKSKDGWPMPPEDDIIKAVDGNHAIPSANHYIQLEAELGYEIESAYWNTTTKDASFTMFSWAAETLLPYDSTGQKVIFGALSKQEKHLFIIAQHHFTSSKAIQDFFLSVLTKSDTYHYDLQDMAFTLSNTQKRFKVNHTIVTELLKSLWSKLVVFNNIIRLRALC